MKPTRKAHLPRRDDLPALKVSTARKAGVITPLMHDVEIEIGGHKRRVGLWHMFFRWNSGSWSYFLCPSCGRRCQTLRLYDGRFVCSSCDGLYCRAQVVVIPRQRRGGDRGPRLEWLRALVAEPQLHHRRTAEIALRRAVIVERRKRLRGWPPKP
jgi:hypothetical protein